MTCCRILLLLLTGLVGLPCLQAQTLSEEDLSWLTPFERSRGRATATYDEGIAYYRRLADESPRARLLTYGRTDVGRPLHLFVISATEVFDPEQLHQAQKTILLVNNAIHPGEPCGVDASMRLARDVLILDKYPALMQQTVLCIIPFYNVGGTLNRGCCSRANQKGPEAYGFRGNARNLDLNRDFIKADAQNTFAFYELFQTWQPDVFIDTHTTNGADYPYTMTLIATQHNKLHPHLGTYLHDSMLPALYDDMAEQGEDMCPYVFTRGRTPETGLRDFPDSPRYSTGYTALFNCLGFVSEAHMLKPFRRRVEATEAFLVSTLRIMARDGKKIRYLRRRAEMDTRKQHIFPLRWALDTTHHREFAFRGYTPREKTSPVTGQTYTVYDTAAPWQRNIAVYDQYLPTDSAAAPWAYILPSAWYRAAERLKANGVELRRLARDTTLEVEVYYIREYDTPEAPYEGHYLHGNIRTETRTRKLTFYAGDFLIPLNQSANRYIVETLEPRSIDSFFAWNFFDSILQQKEWFSGYLFEDKARRMLAENPDLALEFKEKKEAEPGFADNAFDQLYYLYRQSEHYEDSHRRYPVCRLMKRMELKLEEN